MKAISKQSTFLASFLLLACLGTGYSRDWSDEEVVNHSYMPSDGYVPDEATAIAIAEAILVPIYGAGSIDNQKPFSVSLDKDIWTVMGQLQKRPNRLRVGGVFQMQISKTDARVKSVTHGR
jgi:hypothetical protein